MSNTPQPLRKSILRAGSKLERLNEPVRGQSRVSVRQTEVCLKCEEHHANIHLTLRIRPMTC